MFTRNTIHHSRLPLALMTAVTVGVLAAGAFASPFDYSRERRSDTDNREASQTIRPTERTDDKNSDRDKKTSDKGRKNSDSDRRSSDISISGRVTVNNRDHDSRPSNYSPTTYRGGHYRYESRPTRDMHYGHWVFDNHNPTSSRRSVYFHYGPFQYLESTRVHTRPYVTVAYINRPVRYYNDSYYLARRDNTALTDALSDIRNAWLNGRADLIRKHVDSSQMIAVMLDGSYDYSLDGSDYNDMTNDAIDQVRTVSFTWRETRERTNGDYTAFGTHVYRDDYNATKVVYVSYTLRRIGYGLKIVEVGSSNNPLY